MTASNNMSPIDLARKAHGFAVAAAILLLTSNAFAQSAGPLSLGDGAQAPARAGVSGSGIPLGATELGDTGLSPSPFGIDSTLTAPGPDLTGSLDAPPLGMPGAAGLGANPTGGLSPGVMAPQCAMPGTGFC